MLTLVIGNKNLSSWSLRPWLALRHLGIEFEEVRLVLDTPQFKPAVARFAAAGRVPILVDGDLTVWDSLAILEYANELAQGKGWPADRAKRAHARAVSAEMHSGFVALREHWPMKAAERQQDRKLTAAAAENVARIEAIWTQCRAQYGSGGPWLFGEYSIADAMYAPVVLRFNTYGHEPGPAAATYMKQTLQDEHLREWIEAARDEIAA